MYYKNWFGDQDADRDEHLFSCFVELASHEDSLETEYFSIRAFKGSGKTAFLRQIQHCAKKPIDCRKDCPFTRKLCENERNLIIIPIDVNEISFQALMTLTQSKIDPRYEDYINLAYLVEDGGNIQSVLFFQI